MESRRGLVDRKLFQPPVILMLVITSLFSSVFGSLVVLAVVSGYFFVILVRYRNRK